MKEEQERLQQAEADRIAREQAKEAEAERKAEQAQVERLAREETEAHEKAEAECLAREPAERLSQQHPPTSWCLSCLLTRLSRFFRTMKPTHAKLVLVERKTQVETVQTNHLSFSPKTRWEKVAPHYAAEPIFSPYKAGAGSRHYLRHRLLAETRHDIRQMTPRIRILDR